MRKLRMNLEALQVETFDPVPLRSPGEGTVLANSGYDITCADVNGTCGTSCQGGVLGGCGGTDTPGGGQSGVPSCNCPTGFGGGCVYPTAAYHSCDEMGWVTNEHSCHCLYPDTDGRICCSGAGCSGMC